jgi:hypothetical protein
LRRRRDRADRKIAVNLTGRFHPVAPCACLSEDRRWRFDVIAVSLIRRGRLGM